MLEGLLISSLKHPLYTFISRERESYSTYICIYMYVHRIPSFHRSFILWLYIAPLESRSHIWSAETEELRSQRRELGLTMEHRPLIICDSASQHCAQKYEQMWELWGSQNNAVPRLPNICIYVCIYIYKS